MQSDEVGDRSLYIAFLAQSGLKPFKKLLERAPLSIWEGVENPQNISYAMISFRGRFWDEVAQNWESGGKVKLAAVCEKTKRTPKYWTAYFERHPAALLWVLCPLKDLLSVDPLIRGVLLKSKRIIDSRLQDRNGTIRTREARMLIRMLELLCAKG